MFSGCGGDFPTPIGREEQRHDLKAGRIAARDIGFQGWSRRIDTMSGDYQLRSLRTYPVRLLAVDHSAA
jgi:hypothetical protein